MATRLAGIAIAAFAIVCSFDASSGPAKAGDECLSAPTSTSSPGQRWHYRLERGSNRRCWYLKGTAQREPQASNADIAKPPAAKVDPWPTPAADLRTPAPASTPDATMAQPAAPSKTDEPQPTGSPWPQPETQVQSRDAGSDAPAPTAPDVTEDTAATTDAVAPVAAPANSAPAESEKPEVQVRMLLLAIVCALAFSGLLASTLFSLARFRRKRQQRDANWRAGIANTRRWHTGPLQDNIPAGANSSTKRVIGA